MSEFLFEIFSEEMPARMQVGARQQLKAMLETALKEQCLSYDAINVYTTPRRLTVVVYGLPRTQPDQHVERKGPSVTAPDAAIQGFLASTGLKLADCDKREIPKKGTFFFANIMQGGADTKDILAKISEDILQTFQWPKSMRWGSSDFKWVRPMHSILALFNGEVVPIQSPHPYVSVGNTTSGHRFLAPDAFTVDCFESYKIHLEKRYVVLDQNERLDQIKDQINAQATKAGLDIVTDDKLLNEVVGLIEWPIVLMGHLPEKFLSLPSEVLTTSMRVHQKYFATTKEGVLSPHFFFVSNMDAPDHGAGIIRGNERVLIARLSDADFFWQQDQKIPLPAWNENLKTQAFHAKIGTMWEKVVRLQSLVSYLAPDMPKAVEAALLCKADLATGMVGEFPELQGIMGSYYAQLQGAPVDVVQAIRDQYLPRGPQDVCPKAPISRVVSFADKLDTLVAFFSVGITPTGSKDPFALRRAALGCLRLLIENAWDLDIQAAIGFAYDRLDVVDKKNKEEVCALLWTFFQDRFHVYMKDHGYQYDYILSVSSHPEIKDFYGMTVALSTVKSFLSTSDGKAVLGAYKRIANIVGQAEKKKNKIYGDRTLRKIREESSEKNLVDWSISYKDMSDTLDEKLAILSRGVALINQFLDETTVMDDNESVAENRLNLLGAVRALFHKVLNFDVLEG